MSTMYVLVIQAKIVIQTIGIQTIRAFNALDLSGNVGAGVHKVHFM